MRKSWLSWRFSLLSLVLLLAQQGAVLHELSHLLPALRGSAGAQALVQPLASGSSQAPRSEGRDRADAVCQLCLGFAQMGDLAAWRFVPPDLLALQQTPPRSAPFLWREGTRPPHSARDPPARFTPLLS
ncbi:hypothetical protein KGA65_18530 [Ideonella sp. B7]|uniref:hypothetical protein n=1 Tax=Ideonella benzenivorans TaxID=2831643 RepID=UPI001CEDB3DF|nr:hypothetical protein [Ideonella benzenivorans]MCA6218540.1 hypothetical protein [Ideonella benzenivorans]